MPAHPLAERADLANATVAPVPNTNAKKRKSESGPEPSAKKSKPTAKKSKPTKANEEAASSSTTAASNSTDNNTSEPSAPAPTKTASAPKKAASAPKSKEKRAITAADLSNIHLPGQESGTVPLYDTPQTVRTHITAYLKRPGSTAAQLIRDINVVAAPRGKTTAGTLSTFRGHKGSRGGATSEVFYGAYVFFEKLRVWEGKKKTARRVEMEEVWGIGGMDQETDSNTRFFATKGERIGFDRNGKFFVG